jgi:hypothetical protein
MAHSDHAWRAALSSSLNVTSDVAETLVQWIRLCERIGGSRAAGVPSFSFSLPLADLLTAWTAEDTELPQWVFSSCAAPVNEWTVLQVGHEVASALNWPPALEDKLNSCAIPITGKKLLKYVNSSHI